jgi:hypothetical protein
VRVRVRVRVRVPPEAEYEYEYDLNSRDSYSNSWPDAYRTRTKVIPRVSANQVSLLRNTKSAQRATNARISAG